MSTTPRRPVENFRIRPKLYVGTACLVKGQTQPIVYVSSATMPGMSRPRRRRRPSVRRRNTRAHLRGLRRPRRAPRRDARRRPRRRLRGVGAQRRQRRTSSATSRAGASARRRWRCTPAKPGSGRASSPASAQGTRYKYRIDSRNGGYRVDKADPYGFRCELPPATASIVWDLDYDVGRRRVDGASGAQRNALDAPMSIYEVHLGSWMRVPEEEQPLAHLPRARAQAGGARRGAAASRTSS